MRKLTGRWFLKTTWFGNFKIIVEVNEEYSRDIAGEIFPPGNHVVWQKARTEDIVELDIKVSI